MPQSLHSMVESGMLAPPKDDPVFKTPEPKSGTFSALADELAKMGARHGKKDKAAVQQIHDAASTLVDGVHCCEMAEKAIDPELIKANARHSGKDMDRVKKIHGMAVELGAECAGTTMAAKAGEKEGGDQE